MTPLWLHRFTQGLVACVLILLAAGALVTSTGSGLSVPDWPLSYGQWFPPMVGGVLFEHGHRLIAGFVATLTIFQSLLYYRHEKRKWVRNLSFLAVGLVLLQASLGGITVLFRLPKAISIAHACLAQLFLCLNVVLMTVTSPSWLKKPSSSKKLGSGVMVMVTSFSVLFFVQLLLGATVRHHGAGLAIPDFPLAFGKWIPQYFDFKISIHFAHRLGAYLLTTYGIFLSIYIYQKFSNEMTLIAWSGAVIALLFFQVMLGASVIWSGRSVPITMFHLVVGAMCFASSIALSTNVFRSRYLQSLPANTKVL